MTTAVKQGQVDESKVQRLVGLLKKSVAAYTKSGPYSREGAESKVYSYIGYIEERVLKLKKMRKQKAVEASSALWDSVALLESCDDAEEALELVKLYNPRLPEKVCAELGRRIVTCNLACARARPTYDAVLAFLDLEWAFDEERFPGSCLDVIDEKFLDSVSNGNMDVPVIGGYEDPFFEVDMSIAQGPADAEEARRMMALAQAVNAARDEWRSQHAGQAA